ncbi:MULTISPECIES: hypothetical protein [Myxococcus]|nr:MULTISPECIES: hypothetical protein [Myxococcus]NOJ55955.1 hypothetical protein [Myxococcus xanthus]QPM78614.1 hypothetical protein I5Q59_30805 [Myxococcus xanthus]QVW67684.1 hypothetical protein JTM82_36155 [Myxococcus xanthus DZ2]QZZ53873.1 hypothetical protein MyxoNM_32085 [Myxococcus xanthus]UEO06192.1 hypothetical protein K1515_06635 [Myxococcus xanthus DZ2]
MNRKPDVYTLILTSWAALAVGCGTPSEPPTSTASTEAGFTAQVEEANEVSEDVSTEGLDTALSSSATVLGRFSRYCGKVNSHQSPGGTWTADPDCTSGCNIGGLAYCQKFWPGSTAIRQVAVSSKPNNAWRTAGCGVIVDDYDGTDEFECTVEPYCGDGICHTDNGESPSTCAADCGTCGDNVCNNGENYIVCSEDCGPSSACGDGACNNGETHATCAADCVAPALVTTPDFPTGVLQFATEEAFNSLYHALEATPAAASSLPNGFNHLKGHLSQFPINETTYEVDRAEYLRDLKFHIIPDEGLQYLVNPDMQVLAGGKLYQFTDIGLFQVDLNNLAWFKTWLAANQERIDFDPNFKTVPGEVDLGDGRYQVSTGVVRIDMLKEKMAGSDTTPDPTETVLGRFSRYCGKVNSHQSPGGTWTADPDCTSGCNIGGLSYCQKFWPGSTAIRQVAVSSKPNNAWRTAGCGFIVDDYDGTDEFECVANSPFATAVAQEQLKGESGGDKCNPPLPAYQLLTVGSGFNKEGTAQFGDRRFIFKTKKLNLFLFRSISIKGKLQRRKKALFVKYWGPSYADEIVVGIDNMDLHTSYIFPTPHTYNTLAKPNFTKIVKFKLGNWLFDAMNIDVNINALRFNLTQAQINSFVNNQLNQFIGGQLNNVWAGIERGIINAIDPTYISRYAEYTKKVNSLKEQNRFRITLGKAEKHRGYSHKNSWTFDWNVAVGQSTYSYDMKAGSFLGRARVGCSWHGIRIVRQ